MPLVCEDLASYDVVLVPPSTAEYFDLLAFIEKTLRDRPQGSPPIPDNALSLVTKHEPNSSAILVNRGTLAIASISKIWWFPGREGQPLAHSYLPGTNPSVLLPFRLKDLHNKVDSFWNTIFPGSKRLLMADGSQFGDNTDVRAPADDELRRGGWVTLGGPTPTPSEPLKLTLDGVFFVDGGFAGPNRLGTWEHTVSAAEAYLACGELARKADNPAKFFSQVEELTGQAADSRIPPPPPPPDFRSRALNPESIRKYECQALVSLIQLARSTNGDEATMAAVAAWADMPVPKFHKL